MLIWQGHISILLFLYLYLNASPEGNVVRNIFRGLFWLWIIPGRVLILFSVNYHSVVAGKALPRAGCVGIAFLEVFAVHCVGREVLVAFHHFALIAFG